MISRRRGDVLPSDMIAITREYNHEIRKVQRQTRRIDWHVTTVAETAKFCAWRDALLEAGYTCAAIGKAVGLSREAIRIRGRFLPPGAIDDCRDHLPEVTPPPPTASEKAKQEARQARQNERKRPDGDTARRLKELHKKAINVNGRTPSNHPDRLASRALNADLIRLRDEGYSYAALAEAMNVTHKAVVLRLSRSGYPVGGKYANEQGGKLYKELRDQS